MASRLEQAYQDAAILAQKHYENFPVGSFWLPRKLRRAICIIYAFARTADDIADEGDFSKKERLEKLNMYWQALQTIEQNKEPINLQHPNILNTPLLPSISLAFPASYPLLLALQDVISTYKLPYSLFFDLLRAFKQDVVQNDYQDFQEILQYCHYSANPIGRLLLYLTENATRDNLAASDSICTALQLINFAQDLQSDLDLRNRCYLPLNEMQKLGISKNDLLSHQNSEVILHLISTQLLRAQEFLHKGASLGTRLKGVFGFEIRLIISAVNHITQALLQRKNVYERPIIRYWHWPKIFFNALWKTKPLY